MLQKKYIFFTRSTIQSTVDRKVRHVQKEKSVIVEVIFSILLYENFAGTTNSASNGQVSETNCPCKNEVDSCLDNCSLFY